MRLKNSLVAGVAFAAAVFGATFAQDAAKAASIVNGSFELEGTAHPPSGSFTDIAAPNSTAIQGWQIVGGSIDYINGYWQAASGTHSIDMDGLSAGAISQTVTGLNPGDVYQVSFALSGNPDAGPTVKTLGVTAAIDTNFYNFTIGSNTRASMNWITQSFQFTATGTSQLLEFFSATPCCGTAQNPFAFGPALDDVSITDLTRSGGPGETPLPAALPLFAGGLGVLGLLSRRRKKRAAALAV